MTRGPDRRPEAEADGAFLFALFASAHGASLAGLDPPLRDRLLRQGFAGQRTTYRARYPAACFEVIELDSVSIGHHVRFVILNAPFGAPQMPLFWKLQ
jgi:hypothetical protein